MSEQSGGPGWWQASDGKWYPPEQAPPAPTAPIPSADLSYGAPAYGAPAASAAAAGGGGAGKVIAIVVALAVLAGGGAFFLTRGSSGGGSVSSFCDTAKKFKADADLNDAFNDPAKIDKVLAAFDQLTKAAPSEIKNDMNTMNDVIKKFAAAVRSAGSDQGKQFGAILAASASIDQDKATKAQQNIEKFAKDKCGIDLSNSSSSSSFSFSSFSFDSSAFESSLSQFSTFDESSFSSDLSSLSSEFGTDFFTSSS